MNRPRPLAGGNGEETNLTVSIPPAAAPSTAAGINRLHSELCGLARTSLEKAIRIGELLAEQKAKLKHGEWLPWVKDNLEFQGDQAARYMRVYANRSNPSLKTDLTLTEAYRLLSQPAEEPDCNPPEEPETAAEPEEPQRALIRFLELTAATAPSELDLAEVLDGTRPEPSSQRAREVRQTQPRIERKWGQSGVISFFQTSEAAAEVLKRVRQLSCTDASSPRSYKTKPVREPGTLGALKYYWNSADERTRADFSAWLREEAGV